MATRNLIMVVDRKHSSNFQEGFALHPDIVNEHSYVNMYMHHDGYPEWQGVQLANWIHANARQDGSRLASKLVHDMYYDSCYLYNDASDIDHEYRYIIWTGDRDKIHVSCWNMYNSKCVFVLKPEKIISKYMEDMEYTDFANEETRYKQRSGEIEYIKSAKNHAQRIIDLLTHDDY